MYLGLEVTAKMEHKEADSDLVFMRDPKSEGGLIELTRRRTQKEFVQPPMEKRLFDHLGFKVSDIFDAVGEMMRGGVKIVSVPKKFNAETLIAFVEDPDGTLIELIQHI
jgi:catechol 2,3-dioxygenase-like lactoylglutathione lyase family enzyme